MVSLSHSSRPSSSILQPWAHSWQDVRTFTLPYAPKRALLGRRLPLRLPRRAECGSHVRVMDNVHLQGVAAVRTDRCGQAIPCDNADWVCDRPQLVHDLFNVVLRAQSSNLGISVNQGATVLQRRTTSSSAEGIPRCDVDRICVWYSLWVLDRGSLVYKRLMCVRISQVRCCVCFCVVWELSGQRSHKMRRWIFRIMNRAMKRNATWTSRR